MSTIGFQFFFCTMKNDKTINFTWCWWMPCYNFFKPLECVCHFCTECPPSMALAMDMYTKSLSSAGLIAYS